MNGYRIRRVEDADPVIDLRSMLRGVLGGSVRLRPAGPPRESHGGISFEAISNARMLGSITLQKPQVPATGESRWRPEVATLRRLHEDQGCREALLDVAQQWARANTNSRTERLLATTW